MSRIERVQDGTAVPDTPPAPLAPFPSHLRPPRTSLDLVVRDGVLSTLFVSDAPLVLVSAPAGWGKTTVLQQWADRESHPHAWLQLEDAHNDPLVLLTSLAAALGQVAPVDPMVAKWVRLAAPPLRERILPSIEASITQTAPFLLVLDDAQVLTDKNGWGMIALLLRAFPAGAQLALGTRTEPPLPLARLQAADQLLQLGTADLALDLQETGDLLRMRGLEADAAATAALRTATEGWAAGISLAALACEGGCTPDWLAAVRGDQRDIARYLTSEVLDRQTRPVRTFLLQTSILSRLSAGLCRAVTRRDDAGAILTRLARDNVFVASLDDRGEWCRYHQLFAELLRSELERRDGARLPDLNRRAAAWFEDHDQLEEAVRHRLAAGDVDRAAQIVCSAYMVYTATGRVATLRRWVELFTEEQLMSNVPLTLAAGWLFGMTGDGESGRRWATAAVTISVDEGPSLDGAASLRSSQVSLRASIAPDGVERMLADAELAAALEAGGTLPWRAGTHALVGAARWLAGDNAGAKLAFGAALDEASTSGVANQMTSLGHLSLIAADEGRWQEAEELAAAAMSCLKESELGHGSTTLGARCAQARVLAHGGDPGIAKAVDGIIEALDQMTPVPWINLFALTLLCEITFELGDIQATIRWSAAARRQLSTWPDAGILRGRLERLRQALDERRLAGHLTPAERRVLGLLATHRTSPEIARQLGVSQNTMKSHVRDIFRKLDVHSRSEAVERAREVGLLRS